MNTMQVRKSWGSHGLSVSGVYWDRWTGSKEEVYTFSELQKEQKAIRELISQDWSEMRTGDQRPIYHLVVVNHIIKLSMPSSETAWGEILSSSPQANNNFDLEIRVPGKTYRWSTACGWQCAQFGGYYQTRPTLTQFKPRCDSFLGRVLRDLGIPVIPLSGTCIRSCCYK